MEIKTQYPYVDEFGVSHPNLIKHWVENGKMLQVETGNVYDVAIDIYPCKYTYVIYEETDLDVQDNEELQNEYFADKEVVVEED